MIQVEHSGPGKVMLDTVAKNQTASSCASPVDRISLPVVGGSAPRIKHSRMSRRRAAALILVHLLIVAHVVHWRLAGRTLSPVEPSEAMYTLNNGLVNAGFVFLCLSLLATLVFGRFVCGWACHVVAYQDLCAWLLRKAGIKVRPFRSRLLVLAPLALAIYMFFWPTLYRWWIGAPAPAPSNHLMTTEFWKTFPGPFIAVVTLVFCGFAVVYFLGAKGFCTYACPYGGLFGLLDKVALGRIRVTDACEHCGHCTAVCSSNVRVHEEVAKFGMVVDPGCMKCMDCVSVCPNDALYFGFRGGTPSGLPTSAQRMKPEPLSLHERGVGVRVSGVESRANRNRLLDLGWKEEIAFAVLGLLALLSFRGLYGQIPLLLAMGMAAVTGFLAIKLVELLRAANVRLQNWSLKRGGRWRTPGTAFAAFGIVWLALLVHSSVVRWHEWRGHVLLSALRLGDEIWATGGTWWDRASPESRADLARATDHLLRADRWGLASTPLVLRDLTWAHLARGEDGHAEIVVRRLLLLSPDEPEVYRGLGGVLRKSGRAAEAVAAYEEALALDPGAVPTRLDLAALLRSMNREDEAIEHLAVAVRDNPQHVSARYQLATARLARVPAHTHPDDLPLAITDLRQLLADQPNFADAHYNLGVAVFMSGDPATALIHVREALRLAPSDPQARAFLKVVEAEMGTGGD